MLDPYISAWELRELVRRREVRPKEVAEFFLARIERINPTLGAFITVTADRALEDAARLEKAGAQSSLSPLAGVPYSIKDLTLTKGIRTTFGSRNYAEFVPGQDAELVDRLRRAGGIMLGKTSTPEFGGRPTTEGGLCPPARNPWNLEHTAGGSSGGAAAAVAAGLHPLAEGSDGGGSVRIPSACCGTVGLKTSRGRVSLSPAFGEAWGGLLVHGPIARTVRDAALMLDVIAGHLVGDPYWAPPPPEPFVKAVSHRPTGLRLAVSTCSALGEVEAETMAAFNDACETFAAMGHSLEEVELDPAARLVEPLSTIIGASLASVPFPNPELIDPIVRIFYEAGKHVSGADYVRAMTTMHNEARMVVQELDRYDALLTPTLTRPAMRLGTLPSSRENYAKEVFGWLVFTFPFNATGQPAISIPNGFSQSGLPLGLQIVGRQNDEAGILALAAAFEEARPWRNRPPVD